MYFQRSIPEREHFLFLPVAVRRSTSLIYRKCTKRTLMWVVILTMTKGEKFIHHTLDCWKMMKSTNLYVAHVRRVDQTLLQNVHFSVMCKIGVLPYFWWYYEGKTSSTTRAIKKRRWNSQISKDMPRGSLARSASNFSLRQARNAENNKISAFIETVLGRWNYSPVFVHSRGGRNTESSRSSISITNYFRMSLESAEKLLPYDLIKAVSARSRV